MQEDGLPSSSRTALVVGHYCHDSIRMASGAVCEALGGSVSYITNVFDALSVRACVVSKVGPDFAYSAAALQHAPAVVPLHPTTEFFADFTLGEERVLKTGSICEPIDPLDIPSECQRFFLGLAVGIVGEISAQTLEKMAEVSDLLIVDVQALIRVIDPHTGMVGLTRLEETPFYRLLDRISYLKAARNEARYIDIEDVRQKTCVIVTEGKHGCTVYCKEQCFHLPAFTVKEVDPTGAGDSFLAGFSAGLYQGLSVEDAALMGNYFGALAVGQVGIPKFAAADLQNLPRIIDGKMNHNILPVKHMEDCLSNGLDKQVNKGPLEPCV